AQSQEGTEEGEEMNDVILYTQPGCGPCIGLKRKLTTDGPIFREVNIREAAGAQARVAELGYTGTPVVEYTDAAGERQHFHGFQAGILEDIKKAELAAAS